jgi:uncharacterized paraquat-inducible protein A
MCVTVICPNLRCKTVLQVPDHTRGQKVKCGRCGKNFIVPEAPETSAPTKPETSKTATAR